MNNPATPTDIAALEDAFRVRIVRPMRRGTFLKLMRLGTRTEEEASKEKGLREDLYDQLSRYTAHDPRRCGHLDCRNHEV